jgi:hypothetical protein
MMEAGPVLERCRNGAVIRWVRIGLFRQQFAPLNPRPLTVICFIRRRWGR